MLGNTTSSIRRSAKQSVTGAVLVALVGIALASCGAGPGAARPDLVVEDPAVTDHRSDAEPSFTFSATVRNAGSGHAAATMLRVYRSDDATVTTSDHDDKAVTLPELPPRRARSRR